MGPSRREGVNGSGVRVLLREQLREESRVKTRGGDHGAKEAAAGNIKSSPGFHSNSIDADKFVAAEENAGEGGQSRSVRVFLSAREFGPVRCEELRRFGTLGLAG